MDVTVFVTPFTVQDAVTVPDDCVEVELTDELLDEPLLPVEVAVEVTLTDPACPG